MELSLAKAKEIQAREQKRRNFILTGNLWKVIIVITLPLFFYALLNYVYGIIDMLMCATISRDAVSAVATLDQIKTLVSSIGAGLSAGGSILIARHIGKNDFNKARRLATTVFVITFGIAVATCAIVIPLSPVLLKLLNVPKDLIDIGLKYFIISIVTAAVMMINTVFMGVEKARGSTAVITLLNVGVIIIKIALSCLFIYGLGIKEMHFVALATLIANLCLTLVIVCRLASKSYVFRFKFKEREFKKPIIEKVAKISFPIFLGKFIFSLGKVIINSMCGVYGKSVVGALGVSNQMSGSVTNALSSCEDSSSSIISQNLGNNNPKRALKAFLYTLILTVGIAIIGVILITVFNDQLVGLYARNDAEYAELISNIFKYERLGIVALGVNSAVLGLLYGFGYTKVSMILNLARVFVFRIPSLWILQNYTTLGSESVGIAMMISNISIGVMALVSAVVSIIVIKKKIKEKEKCKMLDASQITKVNSFIDDYLKNFKPYKGTTWCYEDGVVLLGAFDMYKATRDEKYLNFCTDYFDKYIGEEGELINYKMDEFNIDNIQAGYALLKVNEIRPTAKYAKAIERLAEQLSKHPRTASGSFWHKKRYPYQVWLDGLYMGLPFYALVGEKNHDRSIRNDVLKQFANVEEFNYDEASKQYMHAYDETKTMQWADKETGRSHQIWLRSVGWYAMSITDCYEIYKNNGEFTAEVKLKPYLKKVLASLLPYRDEASKMYKDLPLVEDERNYLEVSGSSMMAYGYLKGSRLGLINIVDTHYGAEILEGIVENFLEGNNLKNICQVSGLDNDKRDGSVDYYMSEKIVANDAKGVGPFMMAYAEYLRYIH